MLDAFLENWGFKQRKETSGHVLAVTISNVENLATWSSKNSMKDTKYLLHRKPNAVVNKFEMRTNFTLSD